MTTNLFPWFFLIALWITACSGGSVVVVHEGASGSSGSSSSTAGSSAAGALSGPGCGLPAAAFCETFQASSPAGNGGDLDDAKWAVARASVVNIGQGAYNVVRPATIEACGTTIAGVVPAQDFSLCPSDATGTMRLATSYDDAGSSGLRSFRIRQPFDFRDRTGIIAFDVDAEARMPGGHGFSLSVFIASEPVPAANARQLLALTAKAAVGVVFEATPAPCGAYGESNGVSLFIVDDQHEVLSAYHPPDPDVTCFATKRGELNHIEIHVNQSSVLVYAADAGAPETLRLVARADGLDIAFSRGYVSFNHEQISASAFTWTDPNCLEVCCAPEKIDEPGCICEGQPSSGPCVESVPHCARACPVLPSYHTYQWDNIGFDGLVLRAPQVYQVLDSAVVGQSGDVSTGWLLNGAFQASTGRSPVGMMAADGARADPIALTGIDLAGTTSAAITLTAWFHNYDADDSVGYRLNGGPWHDFHPPFDTANSGARGVVIPVDLAELQQGKNMLEMRSGSGFVVVANVELVVEVN
ncbi:MAG TPA: hypothetical protein VJN18_10715 [Polyangiaceae bacterium]|nr:hypothetical protein [Polyangiaceae bacterium]